MTEETLFATALEKADPVDRAAFLADACPDPEVRRRVEGLLAAHAAAGSFLDHPAVGGEPTSVLPPSDPDVTHTQAPTDPDATAAPQAGGRAADPDDVLAFLKPSTRPGSLGRLDHYEVLDVLGTGGFGTVMKAFDTRLHRVVAVKVLAPQLAASGAARARFVRESRSAAAVRDDHVVNVFAVSDDDAPVPYLVMELVAGQTLQQKLEKAGPLPPKEVLRIGAQVARGLAAAHATGLIHRDIKPANVLLENGVERVKITDFGLARAADDASISQSGVVAGTPMYMSPEQARGDTLDTRSDLFSLGSVLYALCTGRPPFRADTTLAVLKRVVEDEPRPVRDVNPEVPRWLADVVAKLHAKSPADRFQTAKEVADLLAGYLAELQQQGTVVSRVAAPRRKRVLAGTGWAWWFTVPLVLLALLSAAAVFGEGDPPDMMTRREVHFHLVNGFGFFAGVGLLAVALVSAVSRRWAVRVGAFTAAAAVAAAANGALGLLAPLPPADVPQSAVVTLRLSDAAIQYRFDEQGPNLTGVFVADYPFAPGEHWLWFKHGDRHYRTARFTVGPGDRPELDVKATADGARATLDGRPLAVTPAAAQPGVIRPLQDLVGAKERERNAAKARFDAGQIGAQDYQAAELELAEARANLAVAEAAGEAEAARELVRAAQAWRTAVAARVDAGMLPADALARADDRVAEARVRLVRAGGTETTPPAAEFEPARLQGRWRIVAAERGGAAVPVADLKSVDWIEFRGDRQTTFWNGRTWDGTFTLSASGPVAEIELTSPDHAPVKMLARFDGNQLVMAQGLPGRPRPGGFETGPTTDFAVARYTRAPLPAVAPFTPAQATAHQEAWAAHLGVPVEFAHPSGVAFRLVPPGEFGMGFTDAELAAVREELKAVPNVGEYQRFAAESSGPRHTVRITRPFYLAKYETTAGQFRRFLDATKHQPTGTIDWTTFVTPGQEDRQPVIGVSWDDAVAFCRWLGAGYELPSEAQWEYAARAGGPGLWSFGDDPAKLIDHAAVGQSGAKPGPVGLKTANGFGLFDLHGGAEEWCRDWHRADFYRRSPVDDPASLEEPTDPATGRASRGGSWNAAAVYAKAAFRSFDHPTRPALPKGFRVALTGDLKAAVEAAAARKAAAEPGWVRLFNGTDLTGWKTRPELPGGWAVKDGVLTGARGPGILFSERGDYRDFHLRVEARVGPQKFGAVALRAPFALARGKQPWQVGPAGGYAVELHPQLADRLPPGSVVHTPGDGPPTLIARAEEQGLLVPGEWFTLEVVAQGGRFVTRVNGKEVADGRDPADRYPAGHIALQVWGTDSALAVRKIEVKELVTPPPGEPGFVSLFNGTDLSGWVPVSEGKASPWDVVGGVLALKGQPAGYLRTAKEYREFHLRFEYRATPFAPQDVQRNSAVLWGVRGPDDPTKAPAAARLELVVGKDGRPLATVYSSKGVTPAVPPTNVTGPPAGDGWNRVELVSRAGELEVRVNGSSKAVKGYQPLPGYLGLHGDRQGLHLRNIEVRELIPPSPPTGTPTRAKD